MGHTRVIYTDATTAEAGTVLKSSGFVEVAKGGLFTSPASPVKVYVVWGKSDYYPQILSRIEFPLRIQIHFKCREDGPAIADLALGTVGALRDLAPGTRIRLFDADRSEEITC